MKIKSIFSKISWSFFGFFAVAIGLYPLIYFVIDRHFGLLSTKSQELLNDLIWNIAFYGHIVLGGLALLIGWLQFSKKIRTKRIVLHRRIGKVYMISVLVSGISGLYIAFFATGGLISKIGFATLAIIWLSSTVFAYSSIRQRKISLHQKLMIISYAACFSAVTLRIWLPILTGITGEFIIAYRWVAWLSWVPNMIVAGLIIRKLK